jgi:hypothetical protein
VVPLKQIAYEWRFEGYKGCSSTEFKLTEIDRKTNLTLRANIIEPYPDDVPEFKRESSVGGWNYFNKERLKGYLDKKSVEESAH